MLLPSFISWWYGTGWQLVAKNVTRRMDRTMASFSVPTLARTLFAPWKRITANPGAGIDAKLRAMLDNLVSRFVGFTVRSTVLFSATVAMACMAVAGVIQIILWPLIPFLIVGCIIMGLV